MLKPEQVPDEVVEAAARAMCRYEYGDEVAWDAWIGEAEAAIAAALNAWPGMEIEMVGEADDFLTLPLPQEAGDE